MHNMKFKNNNFLDIRAINLVGINFAPTQITLMMRFCQRVMLITYITR